MSADNHSSDPVRQERDHIDTSRVVSIGVIALVVFAVGIFWAVRIQRDSTGRLRNDTAPRPAHIGQQEIGMVYQPPFEVSRPTIAAERNAPARERLESTGFVDAAKQTVHIPIERAMQLLVARGKL